MASINTSHGMFLATAMAVSGTVILLAFRIQKSTDQFLVNSLRPQPHEEEEEEAAPPRPCLSSEGNKKERKKKKKVHFAEDVVDPRGNSEEYRRRMHRNTPLDLSIIKKGGGGKAGELPANRKALYNGILRDRVHHRVAYSC